MIAVTDFVVPAPAVAFMIAVEPLPTDVAAATSSKPSGSVRG
jgi:hypothetical protein